jgi:hypothetical protein
MICWGSGREKINAVVYSYMQEKINIREITSMDDLGVFPVDSLDNNDVRKWVIFVEKDSDDYNHLLSILSNVILNVVEPNIKLEFVDIVYLNELIHN